ncbi:MAG: DUF5716 family protein [Spirochaetaceae bacterium]|jgi:hypothetical protein|nr:DUF5716 family protein [Spirochaetaceae bacterium]
MAQGDGIFSTLPENFFSPLVWSNRRHYAALLVLYYRLFQENARGIERALVIREFASYFVLHEASLVEEADTSGAELSTELLDREPPDTGLPFETADAETPAETSEEATDGGGRTNERTLAGAFLRRLIAAGWLSDETLPDYSRIINITPYARPFFEALARVEEGLRTEYESHVVAVYSLLYNDAVADNGHYAVLNAHSATVALIDSLKILSGSIKAHYERFTQEAVSSALKNKAAETEAGPPDEQDAAGSVISNILHLHYDLYAGEILDGAYKRLKTSDNLSRYRPRIIKKVAELLANEQWLDASARKLSRNNAQPIEESRRRLEVMLNDIRDTLRAVDPLLEDIDRRNMLYARSSTERVKALLEPDSTIAGKIAALAREISGRADDESAMFTHHLHRVKTVARESLYRRHKHEPAQFAQKAAPPDKEAMNRAENEFIERMRRQLNVNKIREWLDERGGTEKLLSPAALITDEASFLRFIYTVLYAESRSSFAYEVQDAGREEGREGGGVKVSAYIVPDVIVRRKG